MTNETLGLFGACADGAWKHFTSGQTKGTQLPPFLFEYLQALQAFSNFFLRLHLQHVEIPRLRVELELQVPAYPTATAMPDL